MAAPSPTARGTPAGTKQKDGFKTLITVGADATISFWEKTVEPPGADAKEAIDTTTMHNIRYRTYAARQLITMTPNTVKAGYDPAVLSDLMSYLGVETTLTITFPNGDTWAFYGFLQDFKPDAMEEGKFPEATATFTPTNVDPSSGAEAAPVFTPASGT